MKKILISICAILVGLVCYGQEKVYCEIVGTMKMLSGKVSVSVDFGQQSYFKDNRLVDENGDIMTFNSMIDAMNYMSTLGWEFEQAYVVTIGAGNTASDVYHWLLSKYKYEGDDETLKTRSMVKKEQKEKEKEIVDLDLQQNEKKDKKEAKFVDGIYKK
jgi:hypothetical protein